MRREFGLIHEKLEFTLMVRTAHAHCDSAKWNLAGCGEASSARR
jgi:hypothetical protein